ncbi:hypothetical protein DBR06_SOUSAS24710008, partial [Sousa chinensis]
LEGSEQPVQLPCHRVFCPAFLQGCLKPKKPVCAVLPSTLAPGIRAVGLKQLVESTETYCDGCLKKFLKKK